MTVSSVRMKKKNCAQNVLHFDGKSYISGLSVLYLSNGHLVTLPVGRTMLPSVLDKRRSVTLSIFICLMPFQVFPYYITLLNLY